MGLRIEALERRHEPLLSKFENQHPSLTEYLRRYALRHQEKDLLLLREALGLSLDLIGLETVAFRLLVTDAIDEDAARFYERHGFARLAAAAPCRLVLDLGPLTLR